jgi:hypothetical protein
MTRTCPLFRLAFLGLLCCAGCGRSSTYAPETGVIVKGRVVQGGVPLEAPRRDVGLSSIEVQLVPEAMLALAEREETSLQVESSTADENGAFEIAGGGGGVPPGKYRLAVFQRDQGFDSDRLKGAFSPKRTPIEIDVPADKMGDTLDLGTIELNDHVKR